MSAAHSHAHAHAHAHGPGSGHDQDHDEGHGHDHDHGAGHSHAPEVTSRNERVVLIGFLLTFGFMFAEVIGGLLSGSLALIADAGHMMTDAAALALAWAGFRFGRRAADKKRTFGYMRFEVLAGFVNAVALMLLVAWIAYEAALRLLHPAPILAGPMMAVAVLGLLVNGGVFYMLMQGDRQHVNIKGALLHVMGDLLGSVAAILAAGIIWLTGWTPIDPILSVLLSALVLRAAWSLLRNSLHILMEGAPSGLDPDEMRARLIGSVPGLADVSHIHVWSITSGRATATMHVALAEGADPAAVVRGLKDRLAQDYDIGHSTVEIDWEGAAADCPIGRPPAAGWEQGRGGSAHDHRHDPGCGSGDPGREPAARGPGAHDPAHDHAGPGDRDPDGPGHPRRASDPGRGAADPGGGEGDGPHGGSDHDDARSPAQGPARAGRAR